MKILMLVGNEKEVGTYYRAFGWAKFLVEAGHVVTIACDGRKRFYTHSYNEAGIKILETPSFMDGRLLGTRLSGMGGWGFLSIRARHAELLGGHYDVVHSFEHYPSVVLPVYAAGYKKGTVVVSDWCDHFGEGGFRDTYDLYRMRAVYRQLGKLPRKLLDYLEKDVRRRAAAVTVISRYLFDRAVQIGVDPRKITIIRGSVDTDKVRPINKLEGRDKVGINREQHIVTFLGTGQFDVDFALSAFVTVSQQMPEARFLLLGKKTESLDRVINKFALSGKVIVTGWCAQHDLIHYLSSTDVFVLPLRDNAVNRARWPNKIGEYMAMGRPTVCSQVGDVADLVGREHIGLAVENDPLEFGTAILTLLKDGRLADDMGKRARRVAERQFDVAVQGSQIERVYRRLVSEQLASPVRQHKEQSVVSEHSST
jgi:glycosyltransferase involved in cell wall biosynthesis